MTAEETLKQMFPSQLRGAVIIHKSTYSSIGDGGTIVEQVWENPNGEIYQTRYNDWSVDHPDTKCFRVKGVTEVIKKWVVA